MSGRRKRVASCIPLSENETLKKPKVKLAASENETPKKKRILKPKVEIPLSENEQVSEKEAPKKKRMLKPKVQPIHTTLVERRILNNRMVVFGEEMRLKFAQHHIRYLCLMHVDPGYRNGNNTIVLIDLRNPSTNLVLTFKIDLYGERGMPEPTKEDVVDRMTDFMIKKYPRLYKSVHVCSIETQLERTDDEYADPRADRMGATMHALFRSWNIPVTHFDVGIVHRAYPEIYPPFMSNPEKTSKQNKAARYAHNKKCSAAFMKSGVALHEVERELAAMDMQFHIDRRIQNEVKGEIKEKWDDYGDGVIPALVMAGYISNTPLLDHRLLQQHHGNSTVLYVILFPTATFVQEDMAIYREGNSILLLLKHKDFPFISFLNQIARAVLEINDPILYASWDDLTMKLGLCIEDLS